MSQERSAEFKKAFGNLTGQIDIRDLQRAVREAKREFIRVNEDIQNNHIDFWGSHLDEMNAAQWSVDNVDPSSQDENRLARDKLIVDGATRSLRVLLQSESPRNQEDAKDPQKRDLRIVQIGEKATSVEDQGFLVAAIKQRFGIETLTGDFGSKSLLALYKILADLPEGHTTFNHKLKNIQRSKQEGTSWFQNSEQKILIMAGPVDKGKTKTYQTASGDLELDKFKSTTLHEVGHSVDFAVNYMKSKRGNDDYGGWREVTLDQIADSALPAFKQTWKGGILSEQEQHAVLKGLVATGKVDPSVLAAHQDVPDLAQRIFEDATADKCHHLWAMGGASKHASRQEAAECAIGDRVFTQRDKQWWSYSLKARDIQVSDYQFSAAPEWFAEAYAMFMLKKLPPSHPIYNDVMALDGRHPIQV